MKRVSIIIPVFNQAGILKETLKGIDNQTYPKDLFEVIVVDNGSIENIKAVIDEFVGVIYVSENNYLYSPYSARNRGIEISKGQIVVFLDATCVPVYDWLKEGINYLMENNADIVGGDIRFDLGEKLTASKIFDSLVNVNMEESILLRKVAKTGNLFVKKSVFSKIGMFPEGIRSGGDVRWTKRATNSGLILLFCKKAFVNYKARGFYPLLRKQWRVGKGQPLIWKEQGVKRNYFNKLIASIIPPKIKLIDDLINRKGRNEFRDFKYRIYLIYYLIRVIMSISNIYGVILIKLKNN